MPDWPAFKTHKREANMSLNKLAFWDSSLESLPAGQLMVLSAVEEDVGIRRNGADCYANFLSKEEDHVVRWGCWGRQLILTTQGQWFYLVDYWCIG